MDVAIVGVGALGSHAGQLLRSLKGLRLRVIDFDRVERKNVASQFHGVKTVGRNKAQAFRQTMDFTFGTKVEAMPVRLTRDNAAELLGGMDLVVDCLDNGESRRTVQEFVREEGIPCIHAGISADGSFGLVVWDEAFTVDDEPSEGAATCEEGEHLPFISLLASTLAWCVQAYVEGGRRRGFQVNPGGSIPV